MKVVPIQDLLSKQNLTLSEITALRPDEQTYSVSLFQPTGDLKVNTSPRGIDNASGASVDCKFFNFFRLAHSENSNIAATPEYSCPWRVINKLLAEQILPDEGNIWIIGCETITPAELQLLIKSHSNIFWIFEESLVRGNLTQNKFFDPICYIFSSRDEAGEVCLTITIQFKTQPAGGRFRQVEKGMILGSEIYLFQNSGSSIRLVSLNCSDVLNSKLDVKLFPFLLELPYLIFHLLHTNDASHRAISAFRSRIYSLSGGEKAEIICLNWAKSDLGRAKSAIYVKTKTKSTGELIDISDNILNANHQRGMYYAYSTADLANVYTLNYDEHVFIFESTKISQAGQHATTEILRASPEMINLFSWQNDCANWQACVANDGFGILAKYASPEVMSCLNTLLGTPINIERFMSLSSGSIESEYWYKPIYNWYFQLDRNEVNRRISFAQDETLSGTNHRTTGMTSLHYLVEIIRDKSVQPAAVLASDQEYIIAYRPSGKIDDFFLNIFPTTPGGAPATGIFIGTQAEITAENMYRRIRENIESQNHRRMIIWYMNHQRQILSRFQTEMPSITDKSNSTREFTRKGNS